MRIPVRTLLYPIALIALIWLLIPQQHSESPYVPPEVSQEQQQAGSAREQPPLREKLPAPERRALAPREERLSEFIPKSRDVRSEIDKDPHSTPPSLLKFAHKMADRMKPALANVQVAKELMPELESCAQDETTMPSVQALCLKNAERLAQAFPSLQRGYTELRQSAPQAATRLLDQMGALAGKNSAR